MLTSSSRAVIAPRRTAWFRSAIAIGSATVLAATSTLPAAAPAPDTLKKYILNQGTFGDASLAYANVLRHARGWVKVQGGFAAADRYIIAELDPATGLPLSASATAWARLDLGEADLVMSGLYTLTWEGGTATSLQLLSAYNLYPGDVTLVGSGTTGNTRWAKYLFNPGAASRTNVDVKLTMSGGATPPSKIAVWAPDPSDPQNKSLDPIAQGSTLIYNPRYVQLVGRAEIGVIRFMGSIGTNASPLEEWSDRRPAGFLFQSEAPYIDQEAVNEVAFSGGLPVARDTGPAYDHLITLANATGKDVWITLPHAADNTFITQLATLFKNNLNPSLRVWVEYSNEVWHATPDAGSPKVFHVQGTYAVDKANERSLSGSTNIEKAARFAAQRSAEAWSLFQTAFGSDANRVVRVAAGWNANTNSYTNVYLQELASYGPTLASKPGYSSAVAPDVLATTTYSGAWKDILDNLTLDMVDATPAGLEQGARLWMRQSYDATVSSGGGGAGDSVGGGFNPVIATLGTQYNLPIVGYEGGPNHAIDGIGTYLNGKIVPNGTPGGVINEYSRLGGMKAAYLKYPNDPTQAPWYSATANPDPANPANYSSDSNPFISFFAELERSSSIAAPYQLHLTVARALGMRANAMFVDIGRYGKYGNWGHLETLLQNPDQTPKWSTATSFYLDNLALKSPGETAGAGGAPGFGGSVVILPPAIIGQPYNQTVTVTGGDNPITAEAIAPLLPPGLSVTKDNARTFRISGNATSTGDGRTTSRGYVFLRAYDADKDVGYTKVQFTVTPPIPTVLGPSVVVNGSFDANYAKTTNFAVPLTTSDAGIGWIRNANNTRYFTTRFTTGGNPGAYVAAKSGTQNQEASIMQLVQNNRATKGLGRLSVDAYNSTAAITITAWGFNGTAAEVNNALSLASIYTSHGAASGGALGTPIASLTLEPGAAAWQTSAILADFGAGFDYIAIAVSSKGPLGSDVRIDNVALQPGLGTPLLSNADFASTATTKLGYSDPLLVSHAGLGWVENANTTRCLGIANGQLALVGATTPEAFFQVVADGRATRGITRLTIDTLSTSGSVVYGVYGFRGTAAEVNSALNSGGFLTRNALPISPANVTVIGRQTFAEIAPAGPLTIELDFGSTGYDYLVIGVSSNVGVSSGTTPIADNIQLFRGY